jgi:hypothetical protein
MAGKGPAPKDLGKRTRRGAPTRGEWEELLPLTKPILPTLPRDEDWKNRTVKLWKAWRKDPVTQTYGPSEIAMAVELAYLVNKAVTNTRGPITIWGEIRQWMDRLGLTPKGKQDLRYRIISEAGLELVPADTPDRQQGLRVVG